MNAQILLFDRMYRASEDPWGYRVRWYEQRKRDLVLACLTRKAYPRALELGCGNGETTIALAERCESLLACDVSQRAIGFARRKLMAHAHVELFQAVLPDQWPEGTFDLIVVSEMAYYLQSEQLEAMLDHIAAALTNTGEILFCHWRHDIDGCSLNGDDVHRLFAARQVASDLNCVIEHVEPDFRIALYSRDPYSVAEREGLV